MRDGRRRNGQGAQAVFRVDRNCGLLGWGAYRRDAVVAAMNEIFAAVEGRPKRMQGISGQTIEAQMRGTMCQITEYELNVLCEEIASLTAELEEVKADRDKATREQALREALKTVAELSDDRPMRTLARAALTPEGGRDEGSPDN